MVAAVNNSVRRNLSHIDFVVLSLYWVAIGYLWTSLGGLILPDMVIQFVGREHEGFALGVLEAVGSLMAVVWQPIAGALSDRTRTRFGRRRPYIVVGTVGDVLFLIGLALSGTFGLVLIFYFLLQAASNTAQGPYQGLMPDVVPDTQRGTASGYFGVANVVGLFAGAIGSGWILAHAGRTAALLTPHELQARVADRTPISPERFTATMQAVTARRAAVGATRTPDAGRDVRHRGS